MAAQAALCGVDSYTWPDGHEEALNPVYVRLSAPANVTGLPSIAVPAGFSAAGLPLAAQIIGPAFDEAMILRAAQAHEAAAEWHLRRPVL